MDKSLFKNILIVLLFTIAIFCIIKYVGALKEKYDLLVILNETKAKAEALEKEKQNLTIDLEAEKKLGEKLGAQNTELKENLKASKTRLTKLFSDAAETQNELEDLNTKYSLLKAENTALTQKEKKVFRENETLKVRLSSVLELKKAIRELKKQARRVVGAIIAQKPKHPDENIVEGNRGFLMKDGKYASSAKVKIEVIPVSVKAQEASPVSEARPSEPAPGNE